MDKSDVVIIGGVACGCKAAATLGRRLPDAKVTLFQKEKMLSYASCGMPWFASGDIESFDQLLETSFNVIRDAEFFKNCKNFEARTECQVVEIKREDKVVLVEDLNSGEKFEHAYDKLVIATGADPVNPPITIPESDRVMHFTRPHHVINFRKLAQTGKVGSCLIIGGGFIGCEVAEAATSLWGIETTLVEMENHLLPYALDDEMALRVEKEMSDNDVKLHLGTSVTAIGVEDGDTVQVTLENGEIIKIDYVFLCAGVRPNSGLAREIGLKVGESGGIRVNIYMQTSDPNIYAGGDVVELIHQITKQPIYIPMGSLANRHGRIIADHIAGGSESFPGALGAFMIKVFDLNVGSVGLSQRSADDAGIENNAVWASFVDKPDYYPESKSISLKMIFEPESHKLLGLQGVGPGDIVRRVDVFSAFLQNDSKVEDLLKFEHGYAPPYSEALDPLHHLAADAISLERGIEQDSPEDEFDDDNTVVLDVREPDEVESLPFKAKNMVYIPLGELKSGLEKLDKSQHITVLCHRGQRSYQAVHILRAAGFEKLSYIAGGTTLAVKSLA